MPISSTATAAVHLVHGLALFSLGLASWLETRRHSALLLGRQLPWLVGFALAESMVQWLALLHMNAEARSWMIGFQLALMPLGAMLLIRFSVGLLSESGPLPQWLLLFPFFLLVPAGLLLAFTLIVSLTQPGIVIAGTVWSRLLLLFPGGMLTAWGFWRQSTNIPLISSRQMRYLLRGAALTFLIYAIAVGLLVPSEIGSLAITANAWPLEGEIAQQLHLWQMAVTVLMAVFVIRTLSVFEYESSQRLKEMEERQRQAKAEIRENEKRLQEKHLRTQAQARRSAEAWINSLVETSHRIARMQSIDDIMSHVAGETIRLLQADIVSIGLFDEELQLSLRCQGTVHKVYILEPALIVKNELLQKMLRQGQPRRFPQDVRKRGSWYCPTVTRAVQAAAVVPLRFDDNVVGGLWTARFEKKPFSRAQLRSLGHLADQVTIALQQSTMAAQLQSVATIEERSRIAREMHDSLAQVLGYLGLQTQTVELLIEQNEQDRALTELGQLRQNVKVAQADVRESILSLRTTLSGSAGLLPALKEYLCEFGILTGLDVRLVDETNQAINLSPMAEVHLVRIVQEALANIRKHARAGRVIVHLSSQNDCFQVQVRDNGQGFSLPGENGLALTHFGLETMRERAEAVGGQLHIQTAPQSGTTVTLKIPQLNNEFSYGQETTTFSINR